VNTLAIFVLLILSVSSAHAAKSFQTICWDQPTKQAYMFVHPVGEKVCDEKGRVYVGNKGLDCVWSYTPAVCFIVRAPGFPHLTRDDVEIMQPITHQEARKEGMQITP
jgi:hypothetical protein